MYNLLVMGSGRSGTSMATALFRNSGYFFGDSLIPPGPANPFGYYEDKGLNHLNTLIISRLLFAHTLSRCSPKLLHPVHRQYLAAWMAAPAVLIPRRPMPEQEESIRHYLERTPFCFKDPRFNVTLPVWRPYLPEDTRFLVVFREPDRTVDSILRVASVEYQPPLPVTPRWAYLHWARNYGRILDRFADDENWLFVDYNSIVERRSLPAIRSFSEAEVDASELDPSVRLSQPSQRFNRLREARRCYRVHERLRERAARDLAKWTDRAGSIPTPAAATAGTPTDPIAPRGPTAGGAAT
jgi:hypothetical protein